MKKIALFVMCLCASMMMWNCKGGTSVGSGQTEGDSAVAENPLHIGMPVVEKFVCVTADENAVVGDYDVNLTGVVLSIDGVGYDIPDRTSALKIIDVSGIDDAPLMDNGQLTKDSYYTLDGRKVEGAPTKKGVYIVNGNKVALSSLKQ
jgi:hypothetical protein